MQKYVIVQFLDDRVPGYEFSAASWPLHLTMVANFAVAAPHSEILAGILKLSHKQPSFNVTAGSDELFGANRDVLVTTIKMTDDIVNLHNNLVDMLQTMDVVFDEANYIKHGFRAHVTAQLNTRIFAGDTVAIDKLTLVDMFPDGDISRRRVIETVNLDG